MKKTSMVSNYAYQFLYQFLVIVIPLIVSPYLTRVLGKEGLGSYTYVNSIAYYFVVIAMLGISRHGQRVISSVSNDAIKLRKTFWSLFFVHVLVSFVSLIAYLIFVVFFAKEDKIIYLIQGLYVASALFDITWFFHGLENFKSVVVKNAAVKLMECILIFTLVKNKADVWIYTLLASGGIFLGQVVMLPQATKIVPLIKFSRKDICQHIKPLLVLSITVIAVSLYTVFDKTLLGILINKENVAFYEYSNKIITIPKVFITVVGTVMYPRMCRLVAEQNEEKQLAYTQYSFMATCFIAFGAIFGLLVIARPLAYYYYGASFAVCGKIIMSMTPLILIIGLGDVLRNQYIIPRKMDGSFALCLSLNAVINLVVSALAIPRLGVYGAVIGTTAAEIFGLSFQIVLCKQFYSFSKIVKTGLPFCMIGIVMYVLTTLLSSMFEMSISIMLLEVIFGGIIYVLLVVLYMFVKHRALIRGLMHR